MRGIRCARGIAGAVFVLLLLIACTPVAPRPAAGPAAPAAEIDSVPFFPQSEYQCGPAALATMLAHRGVEITPDALVGEVYVPERRGSLQAEMVAAVRARGFIAYPLDPDLDSLTAEIAAGNPVLVMQNLGLGFLPRWHYAVVVGHDPARGEVILRSGTVRRHATWVRTFERTWARSGRWAVVVTPPDRFPATARPLPWFRAAADLERTGQPEAAHAAYRAATEAWPEEAIAWVGLGNSAYTLGRTGLAETALREAVSLKPGIAEAWNNLAHVLAERGCGLGARNAVSCATALRPDEPRFRETAAGIHSRPAEDRDACLPVQCEAAGR